MMAEGDHVMIHSRYTNLDGSAIVVIDIMRIKHSVFECVIAGFMLQQAMAIVC